MKYLLITLLSTCLLSACASTTPTISTGVPTSFGPNAVVVVINDPRPSRRKQSAVSTGYQSRINYDVDPLLTKTSKTIATDYQLLVSYEWPIRSLGAHCFIVESNDPETLIRLLNNDSRVRFAQTLNSFLGSSSDDTPIEKNLSTPSKSKIIPNLYHSENQYGKGQRIAIIDTLADINHPDLKMSDIEQWDLIGRSRGQLQEKHGTAVLGLIAAQHSNGIGINGAAPKAKIGLFRGCWQVEKESSQARCDTVALSIALDAAIRWKPDVINLSLSGPPDRLLEEFIKKMTNSGVVVVAAFDEKRDEINRFPTKRSGVIFAYGNNSQVKKPYNSDTIVISQKDALTLQPGGKYDVLTGHSMAAPIVSSVIALYKESKPNGNNKDLLTELKHLQASYL